mmetsp:Transcript_12340/g.30217  ORF Transcript_12340/g.30217 Transcript_12340/m.30217 type:complete len:371 (+) Transcript_12340:2244-3356(+)
MSAITALSSTTSPGRPGPGALCPSTTLAAYRAHSRCVHRGWPGSDPSAPCPLVYAVNAERTSDAMKDVMAPIPTRQLMSRSADASSRRTRRMCSGRSRASAVDVDATSGSSRARSTSDEHRCCSSTWWLAMAALRASAGSPASVVTYTSCQNSSAVSATSSSVLVSRSSSCSATVANCDCSLLGAGASSAGASSALPAAHSTWHTPCSTSLGSAAVCCARAAVMDACHWSTSTGSTSESLHTWSMETKVSDADAGWVVYTAWHTCCTTPGMVAASVEGSNGSEPISHQPPSIARPNPRYSWRACTDGCCCAKVYAVVIHRAMFGDAASASVTARRRFGCTEMLLSLITAGNEESSLSIAICRHSCMLTSP